jgi:hypothetical protein
VVQQPTQPPVLKQMGAIYLASLIYKLSVIGITECLLKKEQTVNWWNA